jgi:hypothetical protein
MAVAVDEPLILVAAVMVLGVTLFVWFKRGVVRDNAEKARRGIRPFF